MNKILLSVFLAGSLIIMTILLSALPLNAQKLFQLDEEKNPILTSEAAEQIFKSSEFEIIKEESIFGRIFSEPENLKLSELKGKIVVVDFWQTWCAPCLVSFKGFQRAKDKWPDKIEIIAASPDWADSDRKIRSFIRKKDYDFIYVRAGGLEEMLSLGSIPYKLIFGPDGSLIGSFSGSKGADGEFEALEKYIKEWF